MSLILSPTTLLDEIVFLSGDADFAPLLAAAAVRFHTIAGGVTGSSAGILYGVAHESIQVDHIPGTALACEG